mgnify:CR=1 FL=1
MGNRGEQEQGMGYQKGGGAEADLVELVEESLLEDEQVRSQWIEVSREEGVIYLRGRAPNARAREAATRAAARVPGVHAVVNELEIHP